MKKIRQGQAGGKALMKKRGRSWMKKLAMRSVAKRRAALKLLEASKT